MQAATPEQFGPMAAKALGGQMRRQTVTEHKVRELVAEKRRLVEVPYTATLAHTMNTLVANHVVAVPVAAPPGHWIGAGGSMIMESDKQTGAVRKHYIGMVTMLDILAHIAGGDENNAGDGSSEDDIGRKLSVPVSTIIGHSFEGLSLWTLNPNTNILDCMEVFSKGIHRAMVPLDSHMENISGVELMESASCYRMVTQMDVIKFIKAQHDFHDILSHTVRDSGAMTGDTIFAVAQQERAIDAIKCMRNASLQAVPIVEALDVPQQGPPQLINGCGRKLIGTFSATDLRGCPVSQLQSWLQLNAMEFTSRVFENPSHGAQDLVNSPRMLVTCEPNSTLSEVIDKVVSSHVHRVWVTNEEGVLVGLVSLTDIIRVIRAHVIAEA